MKTDLTTATVTAAPNAGASSRGYHRVALYATCPQKFAYWDLLKLEPVTTRDNLALGSLIHIGLMHHYLGRLGSPQARDPFDAMRTAPARIAYKFEHAQAVVQAYLVRWQGHDPLAPLDVEREFAVTVAGHKYTARIDLVALLDDKVVFVDHKSAAGPLSAATFETSGQINGQDAIGRAVAGSIYGREFGGIYINAVGTKPPYKHSRFPISINREFQGKVMSSIAEVNDQIASDADRDPWHYRRNVEACYDRWGPCDYLALCQRGKFALHEYVSARDEASDIAKGAGR